MRITFALAVAAVLGSLGCSSASPDPAIMATELPPQRELSDEQRERVQFLENEAVAQWDEGDHLGARATAERALQIDPRASRALAVFALARLRVAQREQPPVLAESRRAEGEMRRASLIGRHENTEVARLHARFLASLGHLSAAAERAENTLRVSAEWNPQLIRVAGDLRYELGDERRAMTHYERLLPHRELFGADDWADLVYRTAQCRMGIAAAIAIKEERIPELDAAILQFAEYRALRPQDADGLLGEAHAMIERQAIASDEDGASFARALDLLAQAAALVPRAPGPEFDRGVILDRLGRAAEARAAYDAALARDATHVPSLLNLAANQAAGGMTEDAAETCGRALLLRGLSTDERRRLERFVAEHSAGDRSAPVVR